MKNNNKIKIDGMLVATFLTNLFYASTYPYIHKIIMMEVSNTLVAINQIVNCISVIIFGALWNKMSDRLFRFYPVFCTVETILGVLITGYVIITGNIIAYYLLDLVIFTIVTRNICCGGIRLRAIRYNSEKDREQFDNNNNSAASIATIIGSIIAMVLNLDFKIMIVLATFGNIIDNIFYIFIYYNTKK